MDDARKASGNRAGCKSPWQIPASLGRGARLSAANAVREVPRGLSRDGTKNMGRSQGVRWGNVKLSAFRLLDGRDR